MMIATTVPMSLTTVTQILQIMLLTLLTAKKAEVERLKEENNHFANIGKMHSEIRTEAIKDFAERLKKAFVLCDPMFNKHIDNLLEEMVGE